MKQTPLFQRRFFFQRPEPGSEAKTTGGEVMYLRLQGNMDNPGRLLNDQRIFLAKGGTLDVVSLAFGGEGVGRVSYTPGLRAAVKRGDETLTYRFQLNESSEAGDSFSISAFGHDRAAAFRFVIEVV